MIWYLIEPLSDWKHGHHWQLLFLMGWNFRKSSPNYFWLSTNNVCEVFYKDSWFLSWSYKQLGLQLQMVCNMVHTNVCEILYKDSSLNFVPHKNMLVIGNSCLGDNKLAWTQIVHDYPCEWFRLRGACSIKSSQNQLPLCPDYAYGIYFWNGVQWSL